MKKEAIQKIEKYGLENLTKILLYSGTGIFILFLWQQLFCTINKFYNTGYSPQTINLTTTITILGAIFAFWYGYKKYERNKEIEIINNLNIDNNNINKIIIDWKIKKILHSKQFLKSYIWEIIDDNYSLKLSQTLNLIGGRNKNEFNGDNILDIALKNSLIVKNIKPEKNNTDKFDEVDKYFYKKFKNILLLIDGNIKFNTKHFNKENHAYIAYLKILKSLIINKKTGKN